MNTPPQPGWSPPTDFVPNPSALDGITVFAPQPKEKSAAAAAATYTCPNCSAAVAYDVSAGGVTCEYCGYTAAAPAVIATPDPDAARRNEFTLTTLRKSEQGWGVQRQVLHCDSCGADYSLAPGALTATCTFCGSNKVNVQTVADDHLRPRQLVPFRIEKQQLHDTIQKWLGKGWFHPGQLSQSSGIEKRITGIYLPFWAFDATVNAKWEAEVGYDEQESYYDDGEWKTRTVTRWRWRTGHVTVPIDDLLIPGTTQLSRVLLDRLNPFQLNQLVPYHPDFLAGWQAQAYEVTLTDAWPQAKDAMREQTKIVCENDHDGDHIRNFSMVADFADETWRYILLPVYVASYNFADKAYQVMVNGQTGEVVGQKPVAWWKVWLAIAVLLAPGGCLVFTGLPLLLAGGIGLIPLVLGGVLFVAAAIGAFFIYQSAVQSEAL